MIAFANLTLLHKNGILSLLGSRALYGQSIPTSTALKKLADRSG